MFLSQNPDQLILEEIKSEVESKYLKKGHAEKLIWLLKEGFDWHQEELQKPLVSSEGRIKKQAQGKKRNNPTQVPGYADWLYSRRNSIVHGDSIHLSDKDLVRLNTAYGSNLSSLISLRLNSIKAASYFYMDLCKLLKSKLMS